jgi:uncharacterized lipoprotein YbaY
MHARDGVMTAGLVVVLTLAACTPQASGPPPTSMSTPADSVISTDATDAVPWSGRTDYQTWTPPAATSANGYVDPPARWTGISTRLEVPASTRPGSMLEYVVALTNDGEEPLTLTPCPGYRQELRSDDPNADPVLMATWRLSCDGTPVLRPGEARRFTMRIDVPARTPGAELLLTWELVDAWDTGAQAWIPLEPASTTASTTASPTATPSRGQETLPGIASRFLHAASRHRVSLPEDAPVDLYLGGRHVATLAGPDVRRWDAWDVCIPGYAGATCPFNALDLVAGKDATVTTGTPRHSCAAWAGRPPELAAHRAVSVVVGEHCVSWGAVTLYVDQADRVVAVDMILAEP